MKILSAAVLALIAAVPCRAALGVDFDQSVSARAVLEAARPAAAVRAADSVGNMWNTTDDKTVVLKPGQTESAYVDMNSDTYQDQCTTPSPWVGPICHPEVLFSDARHFKLVLTAPIPASWGPVTFRIHLDILGRPDITIEASAGKFAYVLPGEFEDVLKVTPVLK
ncbi:MAG: hypothetical protein KGM24_09860 [Elusimicrobia bacterium]|nr:hypothetical protein [Elusimicrobiota bacterium]